MLHIYLVGMFSHGGGQLLTLVNNPELHGASFLVVTLFGSLKTSSKQFYLSFFSTEKISNVIFMMAFFKLVQLIQFKVRFISLRKSYLENFLEILAFDSAFSQKWPQRVGIGMPIRTTVTFTLSTNVEENTL